MSLFISLSLSVSLSLCLSVSLYLSLYLSLSLSLKQFLSQTTFQTLFNRVSVLRRTSSLLNQGPGAAGWASQSLIAAQSLVGRLEEKLGVSLRALATLRGSELAGCTYRHPLADRISPVVIGGEYITTETGVPR